MKNLRFLYITMLTLVALACDEDLKFPGTTLGIVPTVVVNPDKQTFNVNDLANTAVEFDLDFNNFGGNLEADSIFINVASAATFDATLLYSASKRVKYVTT